MYLLWTWIFQKYCMTSNVMCSIWRMCEENLCFDWHQEKYTELDHIWAILHDEQCNVFLQLEMCVNRKISPKNVTWIKYLVWVWLTPGEIHWTLSYLSNTAWWAMPCIYSSWMCCNLKKSPKKTKLKKISALSLIDTNRCLLSPPLVWFPWYI